MAKQSCTYIAIEESPGGLANWEVRKQRNDWDHCYYLDANIKLLDKDGETIVQVGTRHRWHSPKKFLWLTIEGYTEEEIFTETVIEALHRAQKPISYILKGYGSSFTLYKPPAGKTLKEWGQEKDQQNARECQERQSLLDAQRRNQEERVEAEIRAETEKLLAKIAEIDAAGKPTIDGLPSSSIN